MILAALALSAFQVQAVNIEVNHARQWGEPCAYCADAVYDCEDFAWTKFRKLIELGASPKDLEFHTYKLPGEQQTHLVLVYKGHVLDNRFDTVLSKRDIKRRGYRDTGKRGWQP